MDLRQLRALVAVADERHFTRAAGRLHIAQPALSQQIRRLEDELGLALVDRTTRRVRLTDAGDALVVRARTILAEVEAARAEMVERVGVLAGALTIGMTQTPGPLALPSVLARFHRRHPRIVLGVREGLSRSLVADVRDDVVDLAFVTGLEQSAFRGLERRPLVSEPLVLALSKRHRLAGSREVTVEDLRHERFVAFRPGATIRDTVERAAAALSFEPDVAFETDDVLRLRQLVASDLGVSVLPVSDARTPGPAVCTVPIADPSFVHEISLVLREARRHSPTTIAFLALAAEEWPEAFHSYQP